MVVFFNNIIRSQISEYIFVGMKIPKEGAHDAVTTLKDDNAGKF